MVPIQISLVDVAVAEMWLGLHWRLHVLNQFAFIKDSTTHLDDGDFFEGLCEHISLIPVRWNAFLQNVDFKTKKPRRLG